MTAAACAVQPFPLTLQIMTSREEPPIKRRKTSHSAVPGSFSCFNLDGSDVNLHRRSSFSAKRKAEVKGIRRKGACLRCRILKRAVSIHLDCLVPTDIHQCSGEDPCRTCIIAARATTNSKALSWMECIRPSFQAVNIFHQGTFLPCLRRNTLAKKN